MKLGEIGRARIWADSGVIPQLMMGRARLKLPVCASVCLPVGSFVQSFFLLLLGQVVRLGTE